MKTIIFTSVVVLSMLAAPAFAHQPTVSGVADPATTTQLILASAGKANIAAGDGFAQLYTSPTHSALA